MTLWHVENDRTLEGCGVGHKKHIGVTDAFERVWFRSSERIEIVFHLVETPNNIYYPVTEFWEDCVLFEKICVFDAEFQETTSIKRSGQICPIGVNVASATLESKFNQFVANGQGLVGDSRRFCELDGFRPRSKRDENVIGISVIG